MILAHRDSNGDAWYFRMDAQRDDVAVIARKLSRAASRVRNARNSTNRQAQLSAAMLAEAMALTELQESNGATPEDFAAAPREEMFIL